VECCRAVTSDGPSSAIVRVPPPRFAGVVFNVRVKEPRSPAGRSWNRAMDVSPVVPLTFIVLKLTGVISWSWWWVLSPLWISGILLAVALCAVLVLLRLSSLGHQD
jgi:transmembrane Fragile-X-F protein